MAQHTLWNEELETLPSEQLARLENEKLVRQLSYVYSKSPFYRQKFQEAGLKPDMIRNRNDLTKLPFTTKDEIRKTQMEHKPYGGHLCADLQQVVRVHGTSGTTGQPVITCLTRHDVHVTSECGARALWAAGLRPGDVVFHVFNYSLYAGGVTDHLSAEYLGASVVPVGVGQSGLLIRLVKLLSPTVIHSTPSYPRYLAGKIATEYPDMNPRDLGFRLGLFGGEPLAAELRNTIEEVWGIRAMDANYGMAEVLAIFASECEARDGLHFCGQGAILAELINPSTGEPMDLVEGAEGELVFTTIDREATPLLRYRSGDYVEIVGTGACKCARTSFRFRVKGRSDDMLWVRGVNVFPSAIAEELSAMRPRLTGEFQILLQHPGPQDRLCIRAEHGQEPGDLTELKKAVEQRLSSTLRVTSDVELVAPYSLPRSEKKTARIVRLYEHPNNGSGSS